MDAGKSGGPSRSGGPSASKSSPSKGSTGASKSSSGTSKSESKSQSAVASDKVSLSREAQSKAKDSKASSLADAFKDNFESPVSTGISRQKTVDDGTNLTEIAKESLKAAGFENPTQSQVNQAVKDFSQLNQLTNIDKIQADSQLQKPESLRQGELFNELSKGVIPNGKLGPGNQPAAGFSSELAAIAKGPDGLAGLAKEFGAQQVGAMFGTHMVAIGRPDITMDTAESRKNTINFNIDNTRDHLGFDSIVGF